MGMGNGNLACRQTMLAERQWKQRIRRGSKQTLTSTFSTLHLISGLDTLTDSETNKQSDRQTDSYTVRQTVGWTGMQNVEFLVGTHTQLDCDWNAKGCGCGLF